MSAKTKIVVLHMKEVVYTAIFLALALLMIVLLVIMFGPGADGETAETVGSAGEPLYVAGVYNTTVELGASTFDVQVTVDENHINAVELVNLSETTAAMFPLVEPSLETIASQIYSTQSTENIVFDDDRKYTSQLLLDAINASLDRAKAASEPAA